MFHLQQVFLYNAGETLKYNIMYTLKKPNSFLIFWLIVQVGQLNSYLEMLLYLYYSPKANQVTKKILFIEDADLMSHLLHMCLAKWQTQYDLLENTTPVSTRALLLILESIKNNTELNPKPSNARD